MAWRVVAEAELVAKGSTKDEWAAKVAAASLAARQEAAEARAGAEAVDWEKVEAVEWEVNAEVKGSWMGTGAVG